MTHEATFSGSKSEVNADTVSAGDKGSVSESKDKTRSRYNKHLDTFENYEGFSGLHVQEILDFFSFLLY